MKETTKPAELAKIEVRQFVREPTAAAIAVGFVNSEWYQSERPRNVFMFDPEAGTLDVSLLKVH